eukprot:7566859-Ditylum_brightwellii.AAC.1
MDCADTLPDNLLQEIYIIYKEASDLKFKVWAIYEHQLCKKWIHHKKLGLLVPNAYTYETVCKSATNKFLKECHSDRWLLKDT